MFSKICDSGKLAFQRIKSVKSAMAILVLNNLVVEIKSSVEEFNTREDRIEKDK